MKKRLLVVLIVAVLVVSAFAALIGCAPKTRGENEILLWAGGQWTGNDAANLTKFIEWYNENNKIGVTIDLRIQANFEQTFSGALNTNNGPDLMIWDRFNTPSYAMANTLLSVDEMITESQIDKSKYNATAYEELNYNGKQYGLPLDLDMWGIYVNMDIVNAYNEANPSDKITCFWNEDKTDKLDWTWEECLDVAKKLKGFSYSKNGASVTVKSGIDGHNMNEFFYHYYVSTGKEFLGSNGLSNINNDYGKAELEMFKQMYATSDPGYITEGAFFQGQLAMYHRPTYFVSSLESRAKTLNVRFMPQPKYSGEGGVNRGVLGGYGMAIPLPQESRRDEAWEKKVDRCWDFMVDWLYNEEYMNKWAEISKTVPALLATHEGEAVKQNKVLLPAIPYSNTYTIRPGIPGWRDIQVNAFNSKVPACCKGEITVAEALNNIQSLTDTRIRQNNRPSGK